ncbi:MAG: hypothetical protein HC896_00285 [Bacteroidales bacterium]|nr:hypothetical protein [Bacteroidales bacterium]
MKKFITAAILLTLTVFTGAALMAAETGEAANSSPITAVLGVVATALAGATGFFARISGRVKQKLKQAIALGREMVEAGDTLDKAIADNNVTKEEQANIKKRV